MSNIVNPDDRDPLAQSLERPRRSFRVPSTVSIPSGTRAIPVDPEEPTPPTPVDELTEEAILAEGQAPFDSTTPPDYLRNIVADANSPVPGVRGLNLRPINLENPVVSDIDFETDADAFQRIQQEAVNDAYTDDVIFSQTVRERIGASNTDARSRENYAPQVSPDYSYIIRDTLAMQEQRREAYEAATRPVGVRPDQGMLGVGRNVLQGRPFSPISQRVVEDSFSRLAQDGQYQTRVGRFIRNLVPGENNLVERGLLNLTSGARGAEYAAQVVGDIRDAERALLERNDSYRTLGRRALEEVRRLFVNTSPLARATGNAIPTTFRSTTEESPLLQALAEESPAFRQLMNELGPTLDQRRQLQTNPLRGQYGEFGSAGALSAGMYLLNIPGGVLTGALYEAAGSVRDVLSRVNPTWSRNDINAPTALSPFAGIDVGFTQRYRRDRYLSTIGNPALDWLPRRGQIALGFALDVAADPDGLIVRPVRNAVSAARRGSVSTISDAIGNFDNAVLDLPNPRFVAAMQQQVVRPTSEGVRAAATTAVLPTVRTVDATPVEVAPRVVRRPAARGGNIVTVEDLLNRVEYVTRHIENTAPAVRDVPGMGIPEGVQAVARTTRDYELTLQSAVREANLLASSLTKQDFQAFASNILVRLRNQGVVVSDDGAIQLRQANPMLDSLVVPIRAERSAPLYQNYSDIIDIYRQNPTALPPEAYQLVRRTNADIVNLAKTWEVLPSDATASNARITQLRLERPEFANVWGSPIDQNISAPLRRIVEVPESGLLDTPEVSRMVASQPPITVDVTAAPVNQASPPPEIEATLRRIQETYAKEVNRFADSTTSQSGANRALERMMQLRREGAALIADYPEVAARMAAQVQPTPIQYPNVLEAATDAARTDINMRFQHSVLDDLQRQLGIVNQRVIEQQQLLDALPPLERRFLDSELDTRRLNGEDVPIRSVNTPTSISNETVYPAARRQLFANDMLLPQNTGIENDIRTIIANNSELSSIPEEEALELLRSSVEIETFNAIDVNTNEVLDASELTLDSLLEFNLDDFMIHRSINDMPVGVFDDNGDYLIPSRTIPRAEIFEAYEASQRMDTVYFDTLRDEIVIQRLPEGARYIGGGAYGQTYLMPDGTLSKRGTITTDEVRLQRKAAAQGIAPEVLSSDLLDPSAAREFTMQFLDGYKTVENYQRDKVKLYQPVYDRYTDDRGIPDFIRLREDPEYQALKAEDAYIAKEVYKTIDRLHQAGVVHNDIHTGNIMVNPDTLEVRIIDFGLATDEAMLPPKGPDFDAVIRKMMEPADADGDNPTASISFGAVTLRMHLVDNPSNLDIVDVSFDVRGSMRASANEEGIPYHDLKDMRNWFNAFTTRFDDGTKFVANPWDTDVTAIYSKYKAYEQAGMRLTSGERNLSFTEYVINHINTRVTNRIEDALKLEDMTVAEYLDEVSGLSTTQQIALLNRVTDLDELMQYANTRTGADMVLDTSGLRTPFGPAAGSNSMTDYGYVAEQLDSNVLYHGTHHTSTLSDADVFSLSNEFGPATYLTNNLDRAEMFAKAYPAQDVVSTSRRTPRREQVGNVQAIIINMGDGDFQPASAYADNIFRAFTNELDSRGETRLRRNFKAWTKNNPDPANWWHYLRERYTEDNLTELAKVQLGIRDRLIAEGVRGFRGVAEGDYVIIDPSVIQHRSIPHHVEGTGTVAEALAYRNAVDGDLLKNLPNNTTRAIDAHNKLNTDTYVQNQLAAAVTEQQREVLQSLTEMHEARIAHIQSYINNRLNHRTQTLIELESETNAVVNMELKNINDVCL